MRLPSYVIYALEKLETAGFEAYTVGGCVRDSLLEQTPRDWDICTSATPGETLKVFEGDSVIPTGLQHGTVTLVYDHVPMDITTYRIEAKYTDNRHPESVSFVSSLKEDLTRRDFTVNAMAYHPTRGLVDLFGGKTDLENRVLRAVGEPGVRFSEDALRILRALRFSAIYGFQIEEKTGLAMLSESRRLSAISPERIQSELATMLIGEHLGETLKTFYPILLEVIPELRACAGFEQYSRYHHLDVLEHILAAVTASNNDLTVRLAALLHDIDKPRCFSRDDKGIGHFYGHAKLGEETARIILKRLRFDNTTMKNVCELIRHHDTPIDRTDTAVRRWLNKIGAEQLGRLLALKEADSRAHNPDLMHSRFEELRDIRERMERLLAEDACFSLRDLCVNGHDLMALGIPSGKKVGHCLQWLLGEVIDGNLPNEKDRLLGTIRKNLDYFL